MPREVFTWSIIKIYMYSEGDLDSTNSTFHFKKDNVNKLRTKY